MKITKILSLTVFLFVVLLACNNVDKKLPVVVNYETQEGKDMYNALDKDSLYTNLLGTEKNEAEADTLYHRWLDFNKQLAHLIKSDNFDWGTKDSAVILWNRVYCNGDGKIEYYFYMVRDTAISEERKNAFGKFIKPQLPKLKYNVHRDYKYAQCGSFRHYNF